MIKAEPILSCSKCKKMFPHNELIEKERDIYGITIKEKVCPHCGSPGYTNLKDSRWYDKFILNNNY